MPAQSSVLRIVFVSAAVGAVIALGACQRPIQPETPEALHRGMVESVRRELDALPAEGGRRVVERTPSTVEQTLAPRLDELRRMAGPDSYADAVPPAARDLTGGTLAEVSMSLRDAIVTAVEHNLPVQIARLQPAITEADVIAAEAAFDVVFFANVDHTRLDEPSATPVLNGIPLGAGVNVQELTVLETGIRQPFNTGGALSVSTSLDRLRSKTPGLELSPDPAYTARIAVGLDQPLLRGFGSDVNESEIRFARNRDRRAIEELRASLLDVAERTESTYWNLVLARWRVLIAERSLNRGIEVRDLLVRRQARGDVVAAELADANSIVERRRADLIRAQRQAVASSDQLKLLLNDPRVTVGSEVAIAPSDFMVESPIDYNLREAMITALERRPELATAVLAVDDAGIGLVLADNARLPLLNLAARMEYLGLNDEVDNAYGDAFESSFIDYVIGLAFEQPIGNRAAEAGFRRARLEQSAAVIAYRSAAQQVVFDVKEALRDVVMNYDLIEAARSFRVAQTENLRAFDARDEQEGLSVTRLNIKFQRQDGLALAELEEIAALVNYNISLARLYRAMGVGLEVNGIDFAVDDE